MWALQFSLKRTRIPCHHFIAVFYCFSKVLSVLITTYITTEERVVASVAGFPYSIFFLLHGLSPRANYTDRATAASRRSVANLCG
jgi:hypothetical protein